MSIAFQDLFEPLDDERADPSPIRPHCAKCGRFVPSASVVRRRHPDGHPAEDDWSGTCSVHGDRVDVVWPEG